MSSTQDAIARLWEKHRPAIFARIDTLEEAAARFTAGRIEPGAHRRVEDEAHKLAGSLGTFGYPEGSRLARAIEHMVLGGGALQLPEVQQLAVMVFDLSRQVGRPMRGDEAAPASPPVEPSVRSVYLA